MLRGITMLLVIYSHLCFKLFDVWEGSFLNNVFLTFRMPLFFFVSGFFMYSSKMDYNLYRRRLLNRLIIQLYPTIILLAVFCYITSVNYVSALASPFKGGYWFTFVSVEMYVVLGALILFIQQLGLKKSAQAQILLIIAIVSALLCMLFRKTGIGNTTILEVFSIDPLTHFTPYLCLGCVVKLYYQDFMGKYITKRYLAVAIVLFILTIVFPKYSLHNLLSAIFGIYILHYLCYVAFNNGNKFAFIRKVNIVLAKVGTLTLEIYLLHYIIIYFIRTCFPESVIAGKTLCNTVWEFPIYIAICIIITGLCLSIVSLLNHCSLNKLIFIKKDTINNLMVRRNTL